MKIELLDPARHERRGFESGNAQLDEYLHRYAMQGQRQQLVRVYVAVDDLNRFVGYCTLSAASVRHTELSPDHARRLPRYPLPAVLIGRLASDRTARATGQRIGSRLLIHALKQALRAADSIGVQCVIVDSKPDAVGFYQRFGFMPLQADGHQLYLPIATIRMLATD
ncbi:GNAT family N-acetyltransferase [Chromatium okenii]|jgi:predicted N-acetyltransferase YhbS|uniref:GNAT family N-acetyltransferase n=1 Tax=Chromatium okenii TaxID=61644 RepID=UPI0026EDEFA8|nr:GNAT family N-acetyltransferase [Chromatium okenii]MBV5309576.1 GNAT family N-acetyltransferase [Chromatium okenii]